MFEEIDTCLLTVELLLGTMGRSSHLWLKHSDKITLKKKKIETESEIVKKLPTLSKLIVVLAEANA